MEDKKALEINEFARFLLATLAKEAITARGEKTISLPAQYKEIIEKILNTYDEWKESFSILIDMEEYSKNHFAWERKLSIALIQALADLNKTFVYDFEHDRILITFAEEELEPILSKYTDETLINSMRHFSALLVDYCYTREYQENIHNFEALCERTAESLIPIEARLNSVTDKKESNKNKIKSLFKKNN